MSVALKLIAKLASGYLGFVGFTGLVSGAGMAYKFSRDDFKGIDIKTAAEDENVKNGADSRTDRWKVLRSVDGSTDKWERIKTGFVVGGLAGLYLSAAMPFDPVGSYRFFTTDTKGGRLEFKGLSFQLKEDKKD